jgi:hypothetical protein
MAKIEHPLLEPDALYEAYHQIGLSQRELAEFIGCSQRTVSVRMGEYDIPTRPRTLHREYTEDELLEWIDVFYLQFGVAPTTEDMRGWPGPAPSTYEYRFGSIPAAIQASKAKPRGGGDDE